MTESELPAGAVSEWEVVAAPIGTRFYRAVLGHEWFAEGHGGEREPGDVSLFRRLADATACVRSVQAQYPPELGEDGYISTVEALIDRVATVVDAGASEGVSWVDDEDFKPRELPQAVPAAMLARSREIYES